MRPWVPWPGRSFGQLQSYLTPEIFGVGLLIQFIVVAFVGGVTYLVGPLVGAAFVVVAREILQDLGAGQRLAYAISLIVVVRFLPGSRACRPGAARRMARRPRPRRPSPARRRRWIPFSPSRVWPSASAATTCCMT